MTQDTSPAPDLDGPVAYITSEYPKISHTFILREVEALRHLGLDILTCSVRKLDLSLFPGQKEQEAYASTFFIIDTACRAPHLLLWAHLRLLLRHPRRWVKAVAMAWRIRSPGLKAALWHLFYFLEAGLLADHLRRNGAVHLHAHFSNSGCTVALLTSILADLPYSFTAHGPEEFFRPYENRLDLKIAHARFVVAISHFCRSQLMLFSDPAHWSKIDIVHCGIDPDLYGKIPRESYGKRVLFVGRLDPVKGCPLLLEAFARTYVNHPDATLTFVGDGAERPALEARAQDLGLSEAVQFMGFRTQDQVAEHLAQSDMLVLPSFAEGVPVVLMEAMAARIPTVASRIAGVPELVCDGETGFVIAAGDIKTLKKRLEKLMSNPDLCQSMGDAGQRIVCVDYTIRSEVERLRKLYSRIT